MAPGAEQFIEALEQWINVDDVLQDLHTHNDIVRVSMLRTVEIVDREEPQVWIVTKTDAAIFDLASVDLSADRNRRWLQLLGKHRQKRPVATAVIEKFRRA
jgi:IS4 transposase